MQWKLISICLVLAGSLFCSRLIAEAKSDYEIVNTGITGGGCWVDDTHFLVEKRVPRQGSDESDLEGLYYLDPTRPKDLQRIDLSPIEPSLQKRIHTVSCQDQTLVFYLRSGESGQQLYGVKLGSQPDLIAELRRGGSVNLAGQYVIGIFRRPGAIEEQGFQGIGIYEAHPDCGVKYVKPGLKTLCIDTWMESGWGLPNFRLVRYTWYESVKVKDKSGQEKWVTNPEPPLKLPDGTELKQGYLLRDLENRIVQEIPMKQDPYQVVDSQLDYVECISTVSVSKLRIMVSGI